MQWLAPPAAATYRLRTSNSPNPLAGRQQTGNALNKTPRCSHRGSRCRQRSRRICRGWDRCWSAPDSCTRSFPPMSYTDPWSEPRSGSHRSRRSSLVAWRWLGGSKVWCRGARFSGDGGSGGRRGSETRDRRERARPRCESPQEIHRPCAPATPGFRRRGRTCRGTSPRWGYPHLWGSRFLDRSGGARRRRGFRRSPSRRTTSPSACGGPCTRCRRYRFRFCWFSPAPRKLASPPPPPPLRRTKTEPTSAEEEAARQGKDPAAGEEAWGRAAVEAESGYWRLRRRRRR